jgi:hypothetical protein
VFSTNHHKLAIADLCTIAFFYLLRVGEYTQPKANSYTRTTQFRVCDVTLWHNDTVIPLTTPLPTTLQFVTSATLKISNQKNGHRNQSIHHEAIPQPICPVKALARRLYHIRQYTHDTHTPLCTYYTNPTASFSVTSANITQAVKTAVRTLRLDRQNIHPDNTSSHSLRAGGATALHLNGATPTQIQLLGRWSSDTFMIYIQNQISAFSKDLSTKIATPTPFHNTVNSLRLVNP